MSAPPVLIRRRRLRSGDTGRGQAALLTAIIGWVCTFGAPSGLSRGAPDQVRVGSPPVAEEAARARAVDLCGGRASESCGGWSQERPPTAHWGDAQGRYSRAFGDSPAPRRPSRSGAFRLHREGARRKAQVGRRRTQAAAFLWARYATVRACTPPQVLGSRSAGGRHYRRLCGRPGAGVPVHLAGASSPVVPDDDEFVGLPAGTAGTGIGQVADVVVHWWGAGWARWGRRLTWRGCRLAP